MTEPHVSRESFQLDRQEPRSDDGPGSVARAGDLTGLLAFLSWMKVNASRFDKSPRSIENSRSVWHLAVNRLGLTGDTDVDEIDIADLAKRMVFDRNFGGNDPDGSMRVYAGRLALGREWHRRWRANDPEWMRRTFIPNAVSRRLSHPASTYVYPLARDREVLVKVPADLNIAETEALYAWLRTLARS